jgi:hypothetical protein
MLAIPRPHNNLGVRGTMDAVTNKNIKQSQNINTKPEEKGPLAGM